MLCHLVGTGNLLNCILGIGYKFSGLSFGDLLVVKCRKG